MKRSVTISCLLIVCALLLFGCGGEEDSSGEHYMGGQGTGTLALSLTDAPAKGLQAVYITIKDVRVCAAVNRSDEAGKMDALPDGECRWEVIAEPHATYNLLELVNGVTETLGSAELPAGAYRQIRLMIGTALGDGESILQGFNLFGEEHPHANYLIDKAGRSQPLEIPSAVQSGVKLVHTFEVEENKYTELVLDFDARRSIVRAGTNREKYILKPAVKVYDTRERVKLSGTVVNTADKPIADAIVSAQFTDDLSGAAVAASTSTDEMGEYQLPLEAYSPYTIVVFSSAHMPACILMTTAEDDPGTLNFSLEGADGGRQVNGTISNAAEGADVSLSVRKTDQSCGNGGQEIELFSRTIAPDADGKYVYSLTLPQGQRYKIVGSDGLQASFASFDLEPAQNQDPKIVDLALENTK